MSRFLQMDPKVVETAADALAEAGTLLETAWRKARDEIAAERTVISGHGRLAAFFLADYDPVALETGTTAGQLPGKYAELAKAGRTSAADYRAADRNGAQQFPR